MKTTFLLAATCMSALLAGCSAEETITQCTTAPSTEWMDKSGFRAGLEQQGYQINEFKVTPGNCYEIYGTSPSGEKVEIYYNPVDGSVVKQEME